MYVQARMSIHDDGKQQCLCDGACVPPPFLLSVSKELSPCWTAFPVLHVIKGWNTMVKRNVRLVVMRWHQHWDMVNAILIHSDSEIIIQLRHRMPPLSCPAVEQWDASLCRQRHRWRQKQRLLIKIFIQAVYLTPLQVLHQCVIAYVCIYIMYVSTPQWVLLTQPKYESKVDVNESPCGIDHDVSVVPCDRIVDCVQVSG